jgi:23S rRNA (cytosine1962-C5)-methyltransferase
MKRVTIKKGREKPIRNQHPWVFSGGILRVEGVQAGDIVTVVTHNGQFLARGYCNPKSQIQVRLLTWQDESIDDTWWQKKLARAIDARDLGQAGIRLIHAESDYLPGLIVDRYGEYLVMQALTLTIDQLKHNLAQWLVDLLRERGVMIQGVYERSDVDARKHEGLSPSTGVLWGEAPPAKIDFSIHEQVYSADVYEGHKTGFYLDQVDNHALLKSLIQTEQLDSQSRLLNTFSYTASFSIASGLQTTNVDASGVALDEAKRLFSLNGQDADSHKFVEADCFDYLRQEARSAPHSYDVVVVDPPKFAHNKRQVDRASKGYKDINLHALQCIKAGGWLMTYSCSGAISMDLFQKIIFGAVVDSGRQAQIVRYLHASSDHPIALTFPEGEYLKGLLVRVW